MLLELRVENLLLIDRAELRLGDGLNAITGETGAGKTMLAHALDLLLGGKPRPGIVRPGAAEAYVEGVFAPPPGLLDDPALAELRGRARARSCARAPPRGAAFPGGRKRARARSARVRAGGDRVAWAGRVGQGGPARGARAAAGPRRAASGGRGRGRGDRARGRRAR